MRRYPRIGEDSAAYRRRLCRESAKARNVDRVVKRDAADVSNLQRIADLPRLIRLLAARSASELNLSSLATDAEIPVRTLPPYLDLLETLYLIDRIPAWSTNLSKRVVDRPKVLLLDSGLAARLVNVNRPGMSGDSSSWKGWGHVRWFIEEVPAGAA